MKNESTHNRRQFLKTGIKSAALAAVLPAGINQKDKHGNDDTPEEKFVYRTLGRTGIKVPIVSMGTGDTDNPNLIKAALDSGIILLATGQYYGNGNNERMIGELIKERDRNSVIVMTGGWPGGVNHKEGLFTEDAKTESYIKTCETSMKNLGVEYIDIFLLPFVAKRESVFYEPLLKAMEHVKKQGMAKYIGIATHSWEPEAINAAVEVGIYDIAGRLVRELFSATQPPGQYSIVWDGTDTLDRRVPNGIYFCRLGADDWKDTKQIVWVR